ncbi:MAG: 5-deoxy-glucuronate isomerase [bacterium]
MEASLKKYADLIESGKVNPHVRYDGRRSGLIFDPDDENTPLTMLAFGAYQLKDGPFTVETGEREYVLVPQDGEFILRTEGETFRGGRPGGPFSAGVGESNASALYVPRDSSFEISGTGEMIFYSAPASRKRRAAYVKPGSAPNLSRGSALWRRDVITLITNEISCNLIVGETYSPPGMWSGTPLHIHDKDDPAHGQSDHEEVYYHVMRLTSGEMIGPYGVQLMFDGKRMNKCFLVGNKSAIAIPGGAHPVVAGPVTDHIYGWGLAGKEGALGMWDIPEFAYLKDLGAVVDQLRAERGVTKIPRSRFEKMADEKRLNAFGRKMLELILREYDFKVE